MKFKELRPMKWHPLSILFARSVAFVVDIMQQNKIFVTAVSDRVNTHTYTHTHRAIYVDMQFK